MKKITILIVDDHQLIRDTWAYLLSQNEKLHVIGHTGDGEEAIAIVQQQQPDVLLLDINMAPVDGFEVLKQVRKFSPGTKVIGVSMHLHPRYAKRMMKGGAKGYVSKNSSNKELISAVEEVYNGGHYISQDVRDMIAKQWTDDSSDSGIDLLSPRELEIIRHIRSGLSSKMIAGVLHIGPKTVEVHRHNILKKLKVKNTAALIELVNTHGL